MTSRPRREPAEELLVEPQEDDISFSAERFQRAEYRLSDSCSQLVDIHPAHGTCIHYLRVATESISGEITLSSTATVDEIRQDTDFGILLRATKQGRRYTLWLPPAVGEFHFDEHKRIAVPGHRSTLPSQWLIQPPHLRLRIVPSRQPDQLVVAYVVISDPEGRYFAEISRLRAVEKRLYRKSYWFSASKPADIWNYLINGSIYDPRSKKHIGKRFRCQQCAYAWWTYFGFLSANTEKKLHDLMQDEVAFTTLLDLGSAGEWGHGYWSNEIETHARFHLDGLHLLLSQYSKVRQPIWLEAVDRGMDFVFRHLTEELGDGGLWYLHDTIERSHRHRFKSRIFGKSAGNALCINTHVQALTVLHRLQLARPDERTYGESYERGVQALRSILDYQPAEFLYQRLMPWIARYMRRRVLQAASGNKLSLRLGNALEGRILERIYWAICRRFPRLVMPGGFIKRDLTLTLAAYNYQLTNVKDLLTLYEQTPFTWLRPYIKNGVAFIRKFVRELDLEKVVASTPYYIELPEVLYLYDKLIERVAPEEIEEVERKIHSQSGGYSLDYYASDLINSCPINDKSPFASLKTERSVLG